MPSKRQSTTESQTNQRRKDSLVQPLARQSCLRECSAVRAVDVVHVCMHARRHIAKKPRGERAASGRGRPPAPGLTPPGAQPRLIPGAVAACQWAVVSASSDAWSRYIFTRTRAAMRSSPQASDTRRLARSPSVGFWRRGIFGRLFCLVETGPGDAASRNAALETELRPAHHGQN